MVPVFFTTAIALVRGNVPGFGMSMALVWSWIPVVNSIMTITVVKSYRAAVRGFFERLYLLKTNPIDATTADTYMS